MAQLPIPSNIDFNNLPQDANQLRSLIAQLWGGLELPDYDTADINPSEYQWQGDINPYLVDEVSYDPATWQAQTYDPTVGTSTEIDRGYELGSRDSQLRSLNDLRTVARDGLAADEQRAMQSIMDAQARARKSATASALQGMAARGAMGGGQELAARLAANQAAANATNSYARDMGSDILARQLAAVAQTGTLSGQMRGQDQSIAAQQASLFDNYQRSREQILNNAAQWNAGQQNAASRDNMAATNAANQWNANQQAQTRNYNANQLNQANQLNWQGRQTIDNANRDLRTNAARNNRDYRNQMLDTSYSNRFNTTSSIGNALGGYATGLDAQQAARAQQDAANNAQNWNYISGGLQLGNQILGNNGFLSGVGSDISDWIGGLF